MDLPRVVIVNDNAFQRRLMSDVVQCNEMKPVARDGTEWIDQIAAGGERPSVVVVDLDLPRARGLQVVEKLCALPLKMRPRIIGLSRGTPRRDQERAVELDIEELISGPLDVGGFARSVVEQAREHRLVAEGM